MYSRHLHIEQGTTLQSVLSGVYGEPDQPLWQRICHRTSLQALAKVWYGTQERRWRVQNDTRHMIKMGLPLAMPIPFPYPGSTCGSTLGRPSSS